ncbi:MAG: hypothetical protein IJX13_01045 [Clostridia bacterium]|nr:hypothetical protein [Clostridia bacterium]
MEYLYLLFAMVFSAMLTVCGRVYNNKNAQRPNVSRLYNVIVPAGATLGWLVLYIIDFSFDPGVLIYSVGYGIFYTFFTIGMVGALKVGSTSLTSLVKQVSLVGASVWGFFFWDVPFTIVSGVGIVCIVVSLCLCLLGTGKEKRSDSKGEAFRSILKWIPFALLIAAGNAGCSIIQKYQQMAYAGQHKNMLMLFGVFFSLIVSLVLAWREDRTYWRAALKDTWEFPCLAGLSSAISNVFVLLLVNSTMSPAVIYPGVAVGGLILTIFASRFLFRERLRPMQWCGIAVGCVALVLLNL